MLILKVDLDYVDFFNKNISPLPSSQLPPAITEGPLSMHDQSCDSQLFLETGETKRPWSRKFLPTSAFA